MIFSPDENIGSSKLQKRYNLNSQHLLVHSIFSTFQGEAPYAGRSAVFLRLGGCNRGAKNLSCLFCDTAFEHGKSERISVEEVASHIASLEGPKHELLVITGGEPLMQQEALNSLGQEIYNDKLPTFLQIETNGDFEAKPILNQGTYFNIVCSPKAWDGIDRPYKSLKIQDEFVCSYRCIISATQKEYQQVPEQIVQRCKEKNWFSDEEGLFLSPITVYYSDSTAQERYKGWTGSAIDKQATSLNYEAAVNEALRLNRMGIRVRLSAQTHLLFSIP